jgi:hypothetical protein
VPASGSGQAAAARYIEHTDEQIKEEDTADADAYNYDSLVDAYGEKPGYLRRQMDARAAEAAAAAEKAAMGARLREQQGAPARTERENALMRATDALDGVVRTDGSWDDVRPVVAEALREAGMQEAAAVASVGSE